MNDFLDVAQGIADEAREIALTYFGIETDSTWKEDGTPLTVADTKINSLVIERIHAAFPTHSVHGEEESSYQEGAPYVWVCDPIDGTMPFSMGIPTFVFSLALVDTSDGQPVLGVIDDPVMKRRYWAIKGSGAFRDGTPLHVSTADNLSKTYLNTEGSKDFGMGFDNLETMRAMRVKGARMMRMLSVIYGGLQVANGKFTGTVFFHPPAHDVAALKVIVEEAGGKVTDLTGAERRYDQDGIGFVASNGVLHDEIVNTIVRNK